MAGPQKTRNIELPYDPVIPLLGIYPEKAIQKGSCTAVFIGVLFTTARAWKQLKCPFIDEQLKMWYIHIYSGILLSHTKE